MCRALGSPLDQLVSVVAYERPVLHKLLWTFKESGNREVLPYLTQRLQTVATEHVQLAPEVRATAGTAQAAVVPVPALRRRVRERGFNQAELLAGAVARGLKLPLRSDVLARVRSSSSQKTLNVHDRRTALKGAFAVATTGAVGISPLPRHVILVDDIATTLATLETCAGVLKRAGVRSVVGVVLAHAQR
ncbi:MAG: ComF family protein [Candidatus Andersenbacteria bacterium]